MSNKTTVVRDFQGGLNVVDDDLNLDSNYVTVSDNVHRGVDSSLTVRWGTKLFASLRDGAEVTDTQTFEISVTNGSRTVTINWAGHPFSNREHITITSAPTIGGIELVGAFGVAVVNANQFLIYNRTAATSTVASTAARQFVRDNHMSVGNILDMMYYDDHIVVVDDLGEITKIDADGTKTRIWDVAYSRALAGSPIGWVNCSYVSMDIYKGDLIIVNGQDKPLLANFAAANPVTFLQDIPSGSNTNTPVCKYVKSVGKWLVMAGDPSTPYRVHISCTDAGGTWLGDAAPNDAVQVDVNNVSNSPSMEIRGINKFREFLVVGFDDTMVLVELGEFDGADHVPNVNDTIARNGVLSHKSMIFLGYDLLATDPIGVTSIAKSLYDSSIVPTRMSEFIAPLLQRNINRLSNEVKETEIFAIYSTHDSRYIVFMPEFDPDEADIPLSSNPFFVTEDLLGTSNLIVRKTDHGLEIGNMIRLDGPIADVPTEIQSANSEVIGVIDEDHFVISTGADPWEVVQNFGGSEAEYSRQSTETTGYCYTYNKQLKVKAWARYRGMSWVCGCTSVYGRVFLAQANRIFRLGNRFEPVYADELNNYDSIWANNLAVLEGSTYYDADNDETYTCMLSHTTPLTGTFSDYRVDNPSHWELYAGEPIEFAFELPWADFNKREATKVIKQIGVDARGTGAFTVQMFMDYFYKNRADGTLAPELEMEMVGGDIGGWGTGAQGYGTGRVATRQRLWSWPARGKLFKLRVEGETTTPLKFVAFTFRYSIVGISR